MNGKIKKASRHTNQNEGLIFEKSSPGKRAFELPPLDVPKVDAAKSLGPQHRRDGVEGFPEVSEIEVIRHFTRLSTWNYAIDLGMYPLGSCTRKYNPRVNEFVARRRGADDHESFDAGNFRGADSGNRRNSSCPGRTALYGWCEHERADRRDAARRTGRGRDALELAQNVQHAARWRRARRRPRRNEENSGAVPPRADS